MSTRGERLRAALRAKRVNKQHALAVALNVHESAITRWKNDQNISVENVVSLCKELDISADWLLMGRGEIDQHKLTRRPDEALINRLNAKSLRLLNDFIESIWSAGGPPSASPGDTTR